MVAVRSRRIGIGSGLRGSRGRSSTRTSRPRRNRGRRFGTDLSCTAPVARCTWDQWILRLRTFKMGIKRLLLVLSRYPNTADRVSWFIWKELILYGKESVVIHDSQAKKAKKNRFTILGRNRNRKRPNTNYYRHRQKLPNGHEQKKSPGTSMHIPPFSHGLSIHSSTLSSHRVPVQPGIYSHL